MPAKTPAAVLFSQLQATLPKRRGASVVTSSLSSTELEAVRNAQASHSSDVPFETVHVGGDQDCVDVTAADFARLRRGALLATDETLDSQALYLNDTCVDAWAKVTYWKDGVSGWGVLTFPSLLTTQIMRTDLGSLDMAALKRRLVKLFRGCRATDAFELRAWVLPRCAGLHWTSVLIDFETQQVLFVDSLGSSNSQLCQRGWTLLEAASQALRGQSWDFTGWSWGSLGMLSPLQQNGHDCATFSPILLVRSIALHVPLRPGHQWAGRELDRHRDQIVHELLVGRVVSSPNVS